MSIVTTDRFFFITYRFLNVVVNNEFLLPFPGHQIKVKGFPKQL